MRNFAMEDARLKAEAAELKERIKRLQEKPAQTIQPVATDTPSNPLRPKSFDELIGQNEAVAFLSKYIATAKQRGIPLDHTLLVGGSGLGKTTLAVCIAEALGTRLFQIQAPVSFDTLLSLREQMQDGDVLFVDEIHLQAIQERRGKESMTQPEVFFNIMEDRTLVTPSGVLPFPLITIIGATTDEGMLPDPFINRFPIRPPLKPYTIKELMVIAWHNAKALDTEIAQHAAELFADACRGTPRVLNNYVKNAAALSGNAITMATAINVLDMNGVTDDGLTQDMQNVLKFLYKRAKHTRQADNQTLYQASVSTIATAIGKSRDQKAVQLRIEPYLIEKGYLQVGHGGRKLTDAGVKRAQELLEEE